MGIEWVSAAGAEESAEDPPPEFAFIWEAFRGLSAARQSGMGPAAIPWAEIAAWAGLHGFRLSHFELAVIRRLDIAWLNVIAAAQRAAKGD